MPKDGQIPNSTAATPGVTPSPAPTPVETPTSIPAPAVAATPVQVPVPPPTPAPAPVPPPPAPVAPAAPVPTPAPAPIPVPPPAPTPTAIPVSRPVEPKVEAVNAKPFDPKAADMGGILLPQKNTGPSVLSAQRVNAATVLEAANALLERETKPKEDIKPAEPAKETAAERSDVVPLRTYKGDIEQTVHTGSISLADIAAAQARHGNPESLETPSEIAREKSSRITQVVIGMLLLLITFGIIGFVVYYMQTQPTPETSVAPSSFLYVDDTTSFSVPEKVTRSFLMQTLQTEREQVNVALGLVARLYPTWATSTPNTSTPLTSSQLFAALSFNAPETLVRTLRPDFLLGVHSFDGNQVFLLFKTDSYEQAFASMLQWEPTMQSDLAPLFDRIPRPHIPEEGNTAAEAIAAPQLLETPFADRVVENHDTRVIQNEQGDILLLWTFIDRNTLIITTNEYTLREVISRLAEAPVIPVPGE